MKRIAYIILLLLPVVCPAQDFILLEPNANPAMAEKNPPDNIYIYLLSNYEPASKQKDIIMDGDRICSFRQSFQQGIEYSTKKCEETVGRQSVLVLPKADINNLRNWIEQMHKLTGNGIKNNWDKAKLIYSPKDKGEDCGCYYEIKDGPENTVIKVYCGC